MSIRLFFRLGVCIFAIGGSARTQFANGVEDLANRVAVVRNENSAASMRVADDYAKRRAVKHVIDIWCQDSSVATDAETIASSSYERDIERPIKLYLERHPEIDFVVLTKGIPIRILGGGVPRGFDRFSLDSRLAALGYNGMPGALSVDISDPRYDTGMHADHGVNFHAVAWANRFWNSAERFSHNRFGGYLVTRLDGYTVEDAEGLLTRALEAERLMRLGLHPGGKILLNVANNFGAGDRDLQPRSILVPGKPAAIVEEAPRLPDFNSDLEVAGKRLADHGFPVEIADKGAFIGYRVGLMGYSSWGSNDEHYEAAAYRSLRFAPGAIAETAVSTSARTMLPTTGGQSLIADLIAQGVTGVKGYTDEPLVQAIASPTIMFDRYTRGWTLAESFYAGSSLIGWEDVVVGDPICVAYGPPRGAATDPAESR
jgi:uncharacterized protein (TIGR03790 family)